jgi:exodeoxyribonuclease VII small subunit
VTETTAPATTDTLPRVEDLAFDDALAELQRTVAELEAGGQPLERALALHERGAALIQRCDQLLNDAQLRLEQLVSRSGGTLETRPVTPDDAIEDSGT